MRARIHSTEKPSRIVFHLVLKVTWFFGLILIVLGILGSPQMRFLTGRLAAGFATVASVALVFTGIVWLACIKIFLTFFDRYLSNN